MVQAISLVDGLLTGRESVLSGFACPKMAAVHVDQVGEEEGMCDNPNLAVPTGEILQSAADSLGSSQCSLVRLPSVVPLLMTLGEVIHGKSLAHDRLGTPLAADSVARFPQIRPDLYVG